MVSEHYLRYRETVARCNREYRLKHHDEAMAYMKKWHAEHRVEQLKKIHEYDVMLRMDVLQHYAGSEFPFCACCGEDNIKFLTLDHVNNDGARHRSSLTGSKNRSGTNTRVAYTWAIKNNYPDLFQVLCYNCNCAKGFYGICPHNNP